MADWGHQSGLLKKLGARSVTHAQLLTGNHASVCWDDQTFNATADFLEHAVAKRRRRSNVNGHLDLATKK